MPDAPGDSLDEARALAKVWSGLFGEGREAPRVDQYYLLEELGAGAMGVVYSAFDPQLQRHVALKLLHRGQTSSSTARLLREARALAKVSHPNVIGVHAVSTGPGAGYIAMEYVDGQSLARWLSAGPHPWREVLRLFIAAGRGLAAAHDAGIVHRDFKPANVLLGNDGVVRVADFGLAWEGATTLPSKPHGSDSGLDSGADRLTATGARVGTPAYMAPEQRRGEDASAVADQFAFCVSLYEGLSGQRPRIDEKTGVPSLELERVAKDHATRPPASVLRALRRGLATEPSDRFRSLSLLVDELEAGLHPRRARRLIPWTIAGLSVVGVGASLIDGAEHEALAEKSDPCATATAAIDELWPAERKAMLGSTLAAHRPKTDWATDAIDRYVARWAESRTRTCASYHAGAESGALFDARVECLERRLGSLAAAVDILENESLEPRGVEQLFGALEPVAECNAPPSHLRAVLRPADPAERAAGQELLARVDHEFLRVAAGLPPSEHAVAELRAAVETVTDASARGNARRFLAGQTEDPEARRQLRSAVIADAIISRDPHLLVLGYTERAWLHEVDGSLALASEMLDLADAANRNFAALDPAYEESVAWCRGMISSARARIARVEGDPAAALDAAMVAATAWERFAGDYPLWVANSLNNVGEGLRLLGRPLQAAEQYAKALALAQTRLHGSDLTLGVLHNNRGAALVDAGELSAAADAFRMSGEHLEGYPERGDGGLVQYNLGAIAFVRERYDEADLHFRSAARAFSAHDDLGNQLLHNVARVAVASVVRERGDPTVALEQLDAVAADLAEIVGTRNPRMAEVLLERALALRRAGQLAEAHEDAKAAVSMQAEHVTAGADRAHYLLTLAEIELLADRPEAREHVGEAMGLLAALGSSRHPYLARAELVLAELELEAGEGDPRARLGRAADIVKHHELGPKLTARIDALRQEALDAR